MIYKTLQCGKIRGLSVQHNRLCGIALEGIVSFHFLFFIVLMIAPLITMTKNKDKLDNYNVDVTEF